MLGGSLETGAKRFGELRDSVAGISEKTLTQTLRGLERDGVVTRHAHPACRAWAECYINDFEQARAHYDDLWSASGWGLGS